MGAFRQLFGDPDPETLERALDALMGAITKAGGAIGPETVLGEPEAGGGRVATGTSSHPFKITPNGDDTIKVVDCGIWNIRGADPAVSEFVDLGDSGDITVTGPGPIHIKIPLTEENVASGNTADGDQVSTYQKYYNSGGTVTWGFDSIPSPSTPHAAGTSDWHFEIGTVDLDGSGVAIATAQYVTDYFILPILNYVSVT